MKIQSLSDKLFSIGGITYAKGDFIPDYLNTTYVSGAVDQTQCEPVANLINKATGLPMFKAYVNWRQFRNSSNVAYANFNAFQLELATVVSGNFASVGPTGPVGPQGATGPSGLIWKGAWVSGTSYVKNDAVGYGGASYFCILATSGTTTPDLDTTKWALLASQGAVGPTGPTGATGPAGAAGEVGATGPIGPGATQTLQQTVTLGNEVTDGFGNTTKIFSGAILTEDVAGRVVIGSDIDMGKGSYEAKIYNPGTHTASRTYTLPDASGTLALQKYKSYVAKITHSAGNSNPTAVVLENTIGTITLNYEEANTYNLQSSGLFTLNKTVIFATGPVSPLMKVGSNSSNANFVGLTTDSDGFADLNIEIRVYN